MKTKELKEMSPIELDKALERTLNNLVDWFTPIRLLVVTLLPIISLLSIAKGVMYGDTYLAFEGAGLLAFFSLLSVTYSPYEVSRFEVTVTSITILLSAIVGFFGAPNWLGLILCGILSLVTIVSAIGTIVNVGARDRVKSIKNKEPKQKIK